MTEAKDIGKDDCLYPFCRCPFDRTPDQPCFQSLRETSYQEARRIAEAKGLIKPLADLKN